MKKGKFEVFCKNYDSYFLHLKGLMFSKKLRKNGGVLFKFGKERRIDIHMLFVFFPIDVVWMDLEGRIVKIKRNVKPFAPFVSGERASYLLEVNAGETKNIKVGDRLTIKLKR